MIYPGILLASRLVGFADSPPDTRAGMRCTTRNSPATPGYRRGAGGRLHRRSGAALGARTVSAGAPGARKRQHVVASVGGVGRPAGPRASRGRAPCARRGADRASDISPRCRAGSSAAASSTLRSTSKNTEVRGGGHVASSQSTPTPAPRAVNRRLVRACGTWSPYFVRVPSVRGGVSWLRARCSPRPCNGLPDRRRNTHHCGHILDTAISLSVELVYLRYLRKTW